MLTRWAAGWLGVGNALDAESRDWFRLHHSRLWPQSQVGTSTFWLDAVGSWWLEAPEGASVALGVRTPKSG